ncbi:hypothetical protein [Aeromonas cavernicola]|nr:hypothetical protein [Aeromonas cavernicola]
MLDAIFGVVKLAAGQGAITARQVTAAPNAAPYSITPRGHG